MSNLRAYLAANYMSGPKADAILARENDPTLKKKRKKPKNEDYVGGVAAKDDTGAGGLKMRDEDEWKLRGVEDVDLEVLGRDLTTFKKSKNAWATVGSSALPLSSSVKTEEAGPSSPLADVKAEPDADGEVAAPPTKKRRGGLKTAAQLRAEVEAAKAAKSPSPEPPGEEENRNKTVHRDASGRIVDVEKLKAEEREREEEEKRKEKEREEWSKGIVQRRQREERVREERDMADRDVGRHAGDAAMNRELMEVERWNDPAASFLTSKKKTKSRRRRPTYQGAPFPNRFGILPGFRWDGVDRSAKDPDRKLSFEARFFQAQNSRARKELADQQFSMEDM
ncbi:putative Bud site selection-related protein [Dioszegia hungarica]|uniref:Bud site selection-related protein n=1 Tax=Dioszegia hungarica TaxID=4972 RepID=A0AA38LWM9_9TREE|nr:putative Bud site selection-related protein [Dioszegia hungarica]KAI9638068.1 putative Bud site selection-related protein [Dioszegia hungarica]